jgi:spermidine synthase
MSGIVRPLSVLLALLTAVTGANSFITRSKTYSLKYDALVAPELVESYLENEGDGEQSLVPYSMVTEVSTNIATDIVQLYSTTNEPKKSDRSDRVLEMDRRCAQTIMGFGRCSIDYYRPGEVEIQISVTFGAEPEQDSAMVVSVDVSMACNTTSMARDILVRSIPHLNTQLKCFHGMVWSIFERQTPTVMKRHWQASVNLAHHQQQSDANKASLEALILERDDLNNRMRIASAHLHESGKRALEVWHYTSPESRFDVRSLFVNGYLQSTTCSSGTAHAEALVHPGLMSLPEPPKKIGIISLEPTAVLREVLRYKEVESVILLGVDSDALEMTKTHISILNDCGFLSSEVTECTSQPQVEVVFEDLTQWLSSQVTYQQEDPDSYPYFDAILVDVPPGDVGWLDLSLQRNIKHLLDDNSIEIIASGSTPVLSDAYVRAYSPNARDKLMRQTHRSVDVGGLGFYHQYVYDEVRRRAMIFR